MTAGKQLHGSLIGESRALKTRRTAGAVYGILRHSPFAQLITKILLTRYFSCFLVIPVINLISTINAWPWLQAYLPGASVLHVHFIFSISLHVSVTAELHCPRLFIQQPLHLRWLMGNWVMSFIVQAWSERTPAQQRLSVSQCGYYKTVLCSPLYNTKGLGGHKIRRQWWYKLLYVYKTWKI